MKTNAGRAARQLEMAELRGWKRRPYWATPEEHERLKKVLKGLRRKKPSKPIGRGGESVEAYGEIHFSLHACCEAYGQHHQTVAYRMKTKGMTLEQALMTKAEILAKAANKTFSTTNLLNKSWV